MMLYHGYLGYGWKPQLSLGCGFILRRAGTDAATPGLINSLSGYVGLRPYLDGSAGACELFSGYTGIMTLNDGQGGTS